MDILSSKQIPNTITILRLLLVLPIAISLLAGNYYLGFYLFVIAGVSDGLDGLLARRFHWTSKFGAFADPIADKLLMLSTYFILGYLHYLPYWLVVIVIARDAIIISGALAYRYFIAKPVYNSTFISKLNTFLQITLVGIVLLSITYVHFPRGLIEGLSYCVASLTVASCLDYMWSWGRQAYLVKRGRA